MKFRLFTAIAITAMALVSCSTELGNIGYTIINEGDLINVTSGSYTATSSSVIVDSVFARNYGCYFGKVKDPETDSYVKMEFMAQFNMLEDYSLPSLNRSLSKDADGKIVADSCELWLYFDKSSCYGDSLTPLKMNIMELDKPMSETNTYYSNFDPKEEGYIRKDGLKKSSVFTLSNLTYSDSLRSTTGYLNIARISLSDSYTGKDGVVYNNYGTYLLRKFYEHPEYFKNSYSFINEVCPGLYFELNDGLGVMAKFSAIELRTYSTFQTDTAKNSYILVNSATAEVLQTIKVTNDKKALKNLADNSDCTFLKAPAGIFTEVTLPVENIMEEHVNDSLLSVNITFQRENNAEVSPYQLSTPTTIMMLPKDSLKVFFEEDKEYDYKSSFTTTLSSNNYTFTNISNLITLMYNNKKNGLAADANWLEHHPNWNKVLLIPISVTTSSAATTATSTGTSVIANEMKLVSTKLKGGAENPIEMNVVFANFSDE